MTSPNIQIQNLVRRYIKERGDISTINSNVVDLMSPIDISDVNFGNSNKNNLNLAIDLSLQTSHLYNFKSTFEYKLDFFKNVEKYCISKETDKIIDEENETDFNNIFNMDDHGVYGDRGISGNRGDSGNQEAEHYLDNFVYVNKYAAEYIEKGILYNIYGAELVDYKWILYNFIISKIYKSFKTNVLNDNIKINSLHLGHDNGNIQSSLNHLFYSSNAFNDIKLQWQWASINKNYLGQYDKYKNNIISCLQSKPQWQQCQFFINKIGENWDKFNLITFSLPDFNEDDKELRQLYVMLLIFVIKFLDSQGVALIELQLEIHWSLLEFNIIAICSLIFNNVYLTKYNIEQTHVVLICKDKKKNLQTGNLVKKLLKVLVDSTTNCIVSKEILSNEWVDRIKSFVNSPILPIQFEKIINDICNNLRINKQPML